MRGPAAIMAAPLTPERWVNLETLFGAERGASSGCWCMWFRLHRRDWNAAGRDGRKATFKAIVERGPPPGVLAYDDDVPVGWCAVSPRREQPVIERSRMTAPIDERPAFAITCFYVRAGRRRQGLMRPLIQAAVALARSQGASLLEAYPNDPRPAQKVDNAYRGLAACFREAGFVEVARRSPVRPIMRLGLPSAR